LGFRDKVIENIPNVDLQSYKLLIVGQIKSGKTRMWKELMELLYPNNPEAGLLFAWEDGYKSWKLNSLIPLHEYPNAWEYFKTEIVPDLIKESKENPVTKVLGFDTIDKMHEAVSKYVLKKMSAKYARTFTSIGEIGNSTKNADNGYTLIAEEINGEMKKLKNAGYGLLWLGWTKENETETVDGLKFQSLEMALSNSARKPFESQADLICCLYPETKVLNKAGDELEENAVNKGGKEIASKFHSTEVFMYFRSNNYINISGGRFLDLPEKVPYGVKNFMEVFENAVKGQLDDGENIEKLRTQEIKNREDHAKGLPEKDSKETIEDIVEQIKAVAIEKKSKKIKGINPILGDMKYETVEVAKEVLRKINELV
jgi:hypothetical protein